MANLCQYRNIFGKPNEGIHKTRFLGLAAFDLLGTIILIFCISYYWQTGLLATTIIVSIVTIILHYLFCVPTAFNKFIGLAEDETSNASTLTSKTGKPVPKLTIDMNTDDYVIV